MYMRLSAVLFPVAVAALIATGVWGYQEYQDKNAVLIKAENQYQRAFHDLSFHMDSLHNELGNALAVDSHSNDYFRKSLSNVWRLTSEAQSEINQLPLTLLPFDKTEKFLSHISNFSYRASIRDLAKQPLTEDELKTLKALYQRSDDIAGQLSQVRAKVINQHLRWMDVENALATEHKQLDNTIIDGFKTVDHKVSAYPEINWGPSIASIYQKRSLQSLPGAPVDPAQIRRKAAAFLGLNDDSQARLHVAENAKGTEYSSYSVSLTEGKRSYDLDYTKQGGELIWFMANRPAADARLSADQAIRAAKAFLSKHGYPNMKEIAYDEFDHTAGITLAAVDQGAIVYPQKIVVDVALDNGEATGLNASDYIFEKKKRTIAEPKLRPDQARKRLNADFRVTDTDLALIRNDVDREVLCYQFTGRINGGIYRIFINGDSGNEEKIEKIGDSA